MTEPTIQQLTGEVDDLTRKVNDMANILALLQVNGLNDAFDGSGNQLFGGNRGRLNKNGVEVLVGTSVGTKYFYQYLETAFSTDPANTLPLLAHGAYISPTAIQDDFNAYLTAGNYGRLFVYADNAPAQRAGAEAARGATLAQGYANIGAADDGHFFVKPALYLDSLTADPTGVADGYLWYRSDTDKFYVRANGVTVQLATGEGNLIGTKTATFTITLSALSAGVDTTFATATGTVRLESMQARVTTTATSGGAPNFSIGDNASTSRYINSRTLAECAAGNILSGSAATVQADPINLTGPMLLANGAVLSSRAAVTTFTGGVVQVIVIYTPITTGAVLS